MMEYTCKIYLDDIILSEIFIIDLQPWFILFSKECFIQSND